MKMNVKQFLTKGCILFTLIGALVVNNPISIGNGEIAVYAATDLESVRNNALKELQEVYETYDQDYYKAKSYTKLTNRYNKGVEAINKSNNAGKIEKYLEKYSNLLKEIKPSKLIKYQKKTEADLVKFYVKLLADKGCSEYDLNTFENLKNAGIGKIYSTVTKNEAKSVKNEYIDILKDVGKLLLQQGASSYDEYLKNYEIIETLSKRMPSEFEASSMIIMCYPYMMPPSVYKTIAEDNKILVLVDYDDEANSRLEEAINEFTGEGINLDNVSFLEINLDQDFVCWVRDFSPFFVFDGNELSVVDFTYNRPQRSEQNNAPEQIADYLDIDYQKMDIVHTGGNLMQDGRGTAFSDNLVIEENDRDWDKVLNEMNQYTGTDNYIITIDPQGDYIAHIDCWGKIVAPDKIIVASLPETDERYLYYETVAEILSNTKCVYGYNYRIYRIEEPGSGIIAPYTNSLIANNHVYMPLGEDEEYNEKALAVYREALPGYEVIGVEGWDYLYDEYYQEYWGGFLNTDALHCRTHEVPDKDMIFIDSRDVYRGTVPKQNYYVVKTNIVSYSESNIDDNDVFIYYSINGSEYIKKNMKRYKDTSNFTYVFTGLNSGDDVKYYIEAYDSSLHHAVDPTCGEKDPHHFTVQGV